MVHSMVDDKATMQYLDTLCGPDTNATPLQCSVRVAQQRSTPQGPTEVPGTSAAAELSAVACSSCAEHSTPSRGTHLLGWRNLNIAGSNWGLPRALCSLRATGIAHIRPNSWAVSQSAASELSGERAIRSKLKGRSVPWEELASCVLQWCCVCLMT